MRKFTTTLICLLTIGTVFSQDDLPQTSIQGLFERNEDQITSLAEAFSEDLYDWSPAEGIRSVGQVLLHAAQANYFFMMNLGFELPAEVDMMTMASTTGKSNIIDIVEKSFDFTKERMTQIPTDALAETITLPFGEFSKLTSLLILLEHSGEHKGQLIAYARSNGITPPWSE